MEDKLGNIFSFNCDKCNFGCISQQILDEYRKGHEPTPIKTIEPLK
jgi:hypothetical protein